MAPKPGFEMCFAPSQNTSRIQNKELEAPPFVLQACSAVAPAFKKSTAECWYYRNDTGCAATKDKPWGPAKVVGVPGCSAFSPGSDQTVCDAVPQDSEVQRLCACKGGRARRVSAERVPALNLASGGRRNLLSVELESAEVAPTLTANVLANRWLSRMRKSSSAATRASTPPAFGTWFATTALATSLAFGSGGGGGSAALLQGVAVSVVAAIALLPSPSTAHNWMMTPSRSYKKAATTMPCILRKATDTHQQVGPGQSFVMKFALGHAGDTGAQCIHPIKDVSDPKCIPIGKEYTSIVLIKARQSQIITSLPFSKWRNNIWI